MSRTVLVVFAALFVSVLGSPVSSVRNDELDVFFDKVNHFLRNVLQLSVYNQDFTYGPIKVTLDYLEIGGLDTWSPKGDHRQLNGTSTNGTVKYDFDVSFGLDQFSVNFSYYVHNLTPQLPGFRHKGNVSIDLDYIRLLGTFNSHGTPYDGGECYVWLDGEELDWNPAFNVKITPENDLNNYIVQVLRIVRNAVLNIFQNAPYLYGILSKYLGLEEAISFWTCLILSPDQM